MTTTPGPSTYLTTREVADLLRVRERKVYDLAAANEIPHRRITGKLLFPADEIQGWIDGGTAGTAERPPILAGSHDPLLDWAAREAGAGLATLYDGSAAGLRDFAAGEASLSALHIPEDDGWNIETVSGMDLRNCVLIGVARRTQGLILPRNAGDRIGGLQDLQGARIVLRQPGAGARSLFDRLAQSAGMTDVTVLDATARTETDAAQAVARGDADASFGLEAAARQFDLGFAPLVQEQFDLLIDRKAYFQDPVQTLLRFLRSDQAAAKAVALGGYDLNPLGEVRWVSP